MIKQYINHERIVSRLSMLRNAKNDGNCCTTTWTSAGSYTIAEDTDSSTGDGVPISYLQSLGSRMSIL